MPAGSPTRQKFLRYRTYSRVPKGVSSVPRMVVSVRSNVRVQRSHFRRYAPLIALARAWCVTRPMGSAGNLARTIPQLAASRPQQRVAASS
jgi:hypothetical protein